MAEDAPQWRDNSKTTCGLSGYGKADPDTMAYGWVLFGRYPNPCRFQPDNGRQQMGTGILEWATGEFESEVGIQSHKSIESEKL